MAIITEASPPPQRPAGRDQSAFRAARRHTRWVLFLRKAIPVGAAAAVVGLIVLPFLNPLKNLPNVSIGSVAIVNGKIKMEIPRLSGYRKDNRPYEVTAESALQDIRNPSKVELDRLTANLQMEREGLVTVKAKTGFYDTQAEKMSLVDDVTVRTDTGYDVRMRTADIDFKAGTVVSREPVRVSMDKSVVEADTMDVRDSGALITFEGRVRAVFENAPAKALAGPEREGSTPSPELIGAQARQPAPSPAQTTRP